MGVGTPFGSGSGLKVFRLDLENIDQAQEVAVMEGWDVRFLPLSTRGYSGSYAGLHLPGLYLVQKTHCHCSFHITGRAPARLVPLLLPTKTSRSLRFRGRGVTESDVLLIDPARDVDLTIEGGLEAMILYLTEGTYRGVLRGAFGPDGQAAEAGEALGALNGPGLVRLKARLSEVLRSNSALLKLDAHNLSRYVTSLVVAALGGSDRDRAKARSTPNVQKADHARRARDFMEARRHEPLDLAELGSEVGISVRTLQYAFQDYFGISPGRYHMLRRLAGAHSELKRADPSEASVTSIATHWGFYHLGRFSRAHEIHFGELPSQTLGQRQVRLFRAQKAALGRKPGLEAAIARSAVEDR